GVGVFVAYSIIHYKTPWIIISIAWPLLFVFAAGAIASPIPRKAFGVVLSAAIGFGLGVVISYLIQPESVRTGGSWGRYLSEAFHITLFATSTSAVLGEFGNRLYACALVCALLGGGLAWWLGDSWKLSESLMRAVQRGAVGLSLIFSL